MSQLQGVCAPSRPRYRRRRRYSEQTAYGRRRAADARPRPDWRFHAGRAPRAYRPPPGLVLAGNVADWHTGCRADVEADPTLRADGRRTRQVLVDVYAEDLLAGRTGRRIASHAMLAAMMSARLGRRVGRATAGNHARALEEAGWIGIEQHGCSALIAGRNLAHAYVLLAPADRPWDAADDADLAAAVAHLEGAGQGVDGHHPVRVSDLGTGFENGKSPLNRYAGKFSLEAEGPTRRAQPELYAPRTHRERCEAVAALIRDLGWRDDAHTRYELGKLAYPFFVAGWPARAVRAAMDRPPVGERRGLLPGRRHDDRARPLDIRNRFALLNHRLGLWMEGGRWRKEGTPLPAPVAAERPRRGRPASATRPGPPGPRTGPRSADALAALARLGLKAGPLR